MLKRDAQQRDINVKGQDLNSRTFNCEDNGNGLCADSDEEDNIELVDDNENDDIMMMMMMKRKKKVRRVMVRMPLPRLK